MSRLPRLAGKASKQIDQIKYVTATAGSDHDHSSRELVWFLTEATPIADNERMRGRRKNPRHLCTDLLKIRWRDESGAARKEYATLEDISEGGLCLRMDSPVAPGVELTVYYPKGKYEGRVKYCQEEGESHVLGIEFLPGYRWSRRDYKPPHLLQFHLRVVEPLPVEQNSPAVSTRRKTCGRK